MLTAYVSNESPRKTDLVETLPLNRELSTIN